MLGRGLEQADVLRIVGVGIEKRRAARAEGAVGVELDRADPEVVVVEAVLRAALEVVLDRDAVVGDHPIDAEIELAFLGELFEDVEHLSRLAGIVQPGQPPTVRLGDCRERRGPHLVVRERRNDAFHERHRVVDENARRLAGRGPLDAAAGRVARRGGHAGGLHRRRVGEDRRVRRFA